MIRLKDIPILRWIIPTAGISQWIVLIVIGIVLLVIGSSLALLYLFGMMPESGLPNLLQNGWLISSAIVVGFGITIYSLRRAMLQLLKPLRRDSEEKFFDIMSDYNRLEKGFKFVAIGGGTGLPASLRGMKQVTSNITAIVTVADDGGSSGRLRRDLGVLPPGDIRNNIAALADESSVLTQLFQYRFRGGDLDGHSFGNLFIAALADIVAEQDGSRHNSLAEALTEIERILNIHGRVLPSTLDDVTLIGSVQISDSSRKIKVRGESQIGNVEGILDTIDIEPSDAQAYQASVDAILDADVIVIGPGSLFTSILPNLMVRGIADAMRATDAMIIYVCNVATQPVETDGYSVAEHVMALERHIGRGIFQTVIANDAHPTENMGVNTRYVPLAPEKHEILQRYDIYYTDLTDYERPWRHDTNKLRDAILKVAQQDAGLAQIIKSTSVAR